MASYTRFEEGDILISSEKVSSPIWSNGTTTLETGSLFSGNAGSYSSDFYLDVVDSNLVDRPVQFSVAYADEDGSGSFAYEQGVGLANYSPSRTMYGQYRSLVLGDEESEFYFTEGTGSRSFWAISIDRARFKESLMPGSLRLRLGPTTGSSSNLMLVDEYSVNPSNSARYLDSGRVYSIFGGTATYDTGSGTWNTGSMVDGYGFFLPDIGILLIDCEKCVASGLITDATGSIISMSDIRYDSDTADPGEHNAWDNADLLRTAIQEFSVREEETVTSNYVWVRAKNGQFNYSMNPSFITANGELRQSIMINSPETYITAVGLYNDNNDLLAVAKLSRPLLKSFSKEALIRIKLDY